VLAVPDDNPSAAPRRCQVTKVLHNPPGCTWHVVFNRNDNSSLELDVTGEHPFFTKNRGWIDAASLELGDICVALNGEQMQFVSKAFDPVPVPVFNLEIEEYHTYFVGDENGNSVLVHNQYDTPNTQASVPDFKFNVPTDPDTFRREMKIPNEDFEYSTPKPQGHPSARERLQESGKRRLDQMYIELIIPLDDSMNKSNILNLGPLGKFDNPYDLGWKIYKPLRGILNLPKLQSAPQVRPERQPTELPEEKKGPAENNIPNKPKLDFSGGGLNITIPLPQPRSVPRPLPRNSQQPPR